MACVDDMVKEARVCCCEGRYRQAERLYSQALATFTPSQDTQNELIAELYNERGVCRYKQVYFDDAVEDYSQALKLNPSLAAAYYNRATIYYRLFAAYPKGSHEREDWVLKAMWDFQEALRYDPNNIEFKEGWQSCRNEMETDDDVKALSLDGVPLAKLVKLLYLLDNGDKETGTTELYKQENTAAAQKAKETFQQILISREYGYREIAHLLQCRAKELLKHEIVTPSEGSVAATYSVKKNEDLLILAEGCHYLGIEYHPSFNDKIEKVQKKMELQDNEKEGNFFIYAENLLMNRICDCLTADYVYKLFYLFMNAYDCKLELQVNSDLIKQDTFEYEGVKEALFFFIIRVMEDQNLLNRIYTDRLREFFKEMLKEAGRDETLSMVIHTLKNYPEECQPAGLCIVFCVTEGREGADSEIAKIQSVFEDLFKFTVMIEKNPDCSTFESYKKELVKTKYRFYDSLVIWFVSHGDETNLILARKENYDREKFIDDFSMFSNFSKKPKIFFMATCRGSTPICIDKSGGVGTSSEYLNTSQDGLTGNRVNVPVAMRVPENVLDISTIYYQMDRLVAYATLPSNISFRFKDEGSVFVDAVCFFLEENQGENITEVLEGVSRLIHQIVFKDEENQFDEESKQACFFESTFQKTFLVPKV